MISELPGPAPEDFIWAGGIEDTFVPQTRPNQRALDEYELMGHYIHWREDISLARELGVQALRWGIPWYRVEPSPGEYDWTWTDQVLPYMVEELGITPIIDLMHYGCPFWLRGEFANPTYPAAVASYAGAVARRYGHLVKWYTPLNEPIVNALMCGRRGLWPPYLRGDRGYVRVMLQLARGIMATVNELKNIQPDSIMVHVDAAGITRSSRPDLDPLAAEDQLTRFLCYDLVTGRVNLDHPLYTWLLRSGAPPDVLSAFVTVPIEIDVLGLNFYPQWSTRQLYLDRMGRAAYRVIERAGAGFGDMIAEYQARYGAPVIVTETSALGSDNARSQWLEAALVAIKYLRGEGVPVLGYTWFPLFTMIDWRYRHGRANVDKYRIELGLYKLGYPGQPRWTPTPLVTQFKSYLANPEAAIGHLCSPLSPEKLTTAPMSS
jgi:beta-glucosidase